MEVDLAVMLTSNILICNQLMKYLDNFSEEKIHLLVSLMTMMISLGEASDKDLEVIIILKSIKWEEEWEVEWVEVWVVEWDKVKK